MWNINTIIESQFNLWVSWANYQGAWAQTAWFWARLSLISSTHMRVFANSSFGAQLIFILNMLSLCLFFFTQFSFTIITWMVILCKRRWMGEFLGTNWTRRFYGGCRTSEQFQWFFGTSVLGVLSGTNLSKNWLVLVFFPSLAYFYIMTPLEGVS